MAEHIDIHVDHRLEEYLRAERLLYAHARWRHPGRIAALVFAALAAGDLLLHGMRWWNVLGLSVGLLFAALPFLLRDARLWFHFRVGSRMREPTDLSFDEVGVHLRIASFDSYLRWGMYSGLLEDEQLLLLTYAGQSYTVLPKRCFASTAEMEAFRALAERRVAQPILTPEAG
ncbi:MAG: YcxB family protein [Myxococcaceae bacterium]|nr:YcxB family protein [Myxococcaceae bacterium]MCI0670501.1 YcxB family protein [Myxococcaceae bacterium]